MVLNGLRSSSELHNIMRIDFALGDVSLPFPSIDKPQRSSFVGFPISAISCGVKGQHTVS